VCDAMGYGYTIIDKLNEVMDVSGTREKKKKEKSDLRKKVEKEVESYKAEEN